MPVYACRVRLQSFLVAATTEPDLSVETRRRAFDVPERRPERKHPGLSGVDMWRVSLHDIEATGVTAVTIVAVDSLLPMNVLGQSF